MDEYNAYYPGLEEKIYPPQQAIQEQAYAQERPSILPRSQQQQQESIVYTEAYQPPQPLPIPVYAPIYATPPLDFVVVSPPDRHKGIAIAGFVLGLISLIGFVLPCGMGVILPCVGITFSALGMNSTQCRGQAIAGLILSILGLLLFIAFYIIIFLLAFIR